MGEACKPENTIATVKYEGGSIMLFECFAAGEIEARYQIDCICGNIEATSEKTSRKVKAWAQMGLSNGQCHQTSYKVASG